MSDIVNQGQTVMLEEVREGKFIPLNKESREKEFYSVPSDFGRYAWVLNQL